MVEKTRKKRGGNMYKKVLVPLDGSYLAECSLNHVKKLAKDGVIGEVILLNVVGVDIPWDEMDKGLDFNAFREKILNASQQYLARVQSQLSADGIKVKTESIEANRFSHIITDYAQKNGVELIIIATHGHTGMKNMLLGSVAFRVLHESHVPVFLIRPESCQV